VKRTCLTLLAASGGLLAQSGITLPRIGFMRDDACLLRPVYGMAGNFILGRPIARPVISNNDRSPHAFDRQGLSRVEKAPTGDCGENALPTEIALSGGRRVMAADNELILRQPDGTETRTVLSGTILGMEMMGEGWIHVREAGRHTAVRLVENRVEMYRLPEAVPR
jgi:hypothetical protein